MEESKGSVAKRTIVRANKAQTVILKGAFTQSNVLSPEELKALSEKTGLYVFPLFVAQARLMLGDLFYF